MKTLPIQLENFSFYNREKDKNGKNIKNKCGRDFLYYALVYYFPHEYGNGKITAYDLDHNGYFGIPVSFWLAWLQIQFLRMPKYLVSKNLLLAINKNNIRTFKDFFTSILFSKNSFQQAINTVRKNIDTQVATGIDISIGIFGLLDHVLFVYGYDNEYLYVFETTKAPIDYVSIDENFPLIKKISLKEVEKRWTRFGRVWTVEKK